MTEPSTAGPDFFAPDFLARLASAASGDSFVARHSTLAHVRIGFQESETGRKAWLLVDEGKVTSGSGAGAAEFTFVGDAGAFRTLASGFPFNRLVRQHRLSVEGDLRACVNEWLLIYAVTRLCGELER
ncbi:MAG: hypothetical protein KGZ91_00605 [Afipia sp.]|nr:hypothetical protein [Afipia sp.]WIG52132.1 MAG: hypothetical protein OJF48_003049 [Afipia sp.]